MYWLNEFGIEHTIQLKIHVLKKEYYSSLLCFGGVLFSGSWIHEPRAERDFLQSFKTLDPSNAEVVEEAQD